MKTTFKTYTEKQAHKKRKGLQEETGLKWDFYHTGDGFKFCPVVTRNTPLSSSAADYLSAYLKRDYQNFIGLAEVSGMELDDVLSGAKTLVKQGNAVATVSRAGGFAAIRSKHSWELKIV